VCENETTKLIGPPEKLRQDTSRDFTTFSDILGE